jgi:DNA-binding NarL/FixJ family response regulator
MILDPANKSSPRVLLVDDNQDVLEQIHHLLEQEGASVVAMASNGAEAVHRALEHSPDVVVMDIFMPDTDGIQAAEEILARLPATRVVFLSMAAKPAIVQRALGTGARGYVLKENAHTDLIAAIRGNGVFLGQGVEQPTREIRDLASKNQGRPDRSG